MQVLDGLDGLRRVPRGAVVSIGNFDGIHLGHRRILETARKLANDGAAALAMLTFEPHPLTVLRPAEAPPRLTPPGVKRELLEAAGVEYLVVLPPEPAVLGMSAERFWEMLRDEVRASHLVEGASFRFGKGAKGTIQKLREWCAGTSVKLHVVESVTVPLLDLHVATVSSSLIRFLVAFGRVREAAMCLGRPYALHGKVVKGFGRGKDLGVPTANLDVDEQLVPTDGVYAGRCTIEGVTRPAAVSIGSMPTFNEHVRQIEAHVIGFDGDLYGREISVDLIDWLRDQRKFASVSALTTQIDLDIAATRGMEKKDVTRPIALASV